MATFNKKENEKKRIAKRKEKEERKEERKASAKKGASLEEMYAYVDENGNLTSTPPDPSKRRKEINTEEILLGARPVEASTADPIRKGIVTHFNDGKGYGFIRDLQSQDSIFVHINALSGPIKEGDKVSFEVQQGHKGPNAVNVTMGHGA